MSKPSIEELENALDTLVNVLNSLSPEEKVEKAKRLYDVIDDLGAIYTRDKTFEKSIDRILRRLKKG